MTVLTKSTPRPLVENLAGNKGISLYALGQIGVPVPDWAILGLDVCAVFFREQGLQAEIEGLLADLTTDRVDRVAAEIGRAILATELPEKVRESIAEALTHLGAGKTAVRSSGVEEDRSDYSFAGQFDTFLNVEGLDATIEHVKKCWASAYSARALQYRLRHGLEVRSRGLAVILQRIAHADRSGVVFTRNPVTGNARQLMVSSLYGLGEALVSGAVDADTLVIERESGRVVESVIGEKAKRLTDRGWVEVAPELRARLSLDPSEIERIRLVAEQIETAFESPQDVEWCLEDGQLWVLQARPITGACESDRGDFQIWDNSNIIENYPGVSSQLTFTFARHVYGRVFADFCRLLGIPGKQLREMDGFLGSVLGYLNGRIYYNLLHWYKLSGLAPFQKLSRRMMEVQMGVDEPLDLERFASKIRSYTTNSRIEHGLIRLRVTSGFVWYFLSLEHNVRIFSRFFTKVFERFNGLDYGAMPPDRVYAHYRQYERELLGRWGRMISLESAIGLSYGLLKMLIRRWMPDAPDWFEIAVIGGVTDMESMQPALKMTEIADRIRARPELLERVRSTPSTRSYAALQNAGESEVVAEIDAYIDAFGYRSQNELKLEEPDLREAPEIFFDMLKAVLQNDAKSAAEIEAGHAESIRKLLHSNLNRRQRVLFGLARKRVRNAIRARETVRFCRSRAFGVARRMFLAIGKGLAEQDVLDKTRDIFHLRLDEIRGCFDGSVSHREIKPLVKQRKADHAAYLEMEELPPRFVTRGPVVAWLADPGNLEALPKAEDADDGASDELRGTPCSPGMAEGKARVVREAKEFDSGILVTYRTDPGWIPVFPAASAILVERGSPLTHAAIVAREFGVPTIVQIPGLTRRVSDGMRLRVNAHTGRITILEPKGAS